jgi:hypothetical protein
MSGASPDEADAGHAKAPHAGKSFAIWKPPDALGLADREDLTDGRGST